jgi:hypothetical protein
VAATVAVSLRQLHGARRQFNFFGPDSPVCFGWLVIGAVRVAVTWFDPGGAERHVRSIDELGNAVPAQGWIGQAAHQLYQVFNHLSDPGRWPMTLILPVV